MRDLYIALTSSCGSSAEDMLRPYVDLPVGMKVGMELFLRYGESIVGACREEGFPVFLDLKFHDIPYTVGGAIEASVDMGVEMVNLHAAGGRDMMRRAAEAAAGRATVLAVTVLTSLDAEDLRLMDTSLSPIDMVLRLSRAAAEAGLDGVVCSPLELPAVRSEMGEDFVVVTPGIRPQASDRQDQRRVATPTDAVLAGATALVVGRPITGASDPASAARAILREIEDARGRSPAR
jgi:orotidine-5'-phosphate decarboxylase